MFELTDQSRAECRPAFIADGRDHDEFVRLIERERVVHLIDDPAGGVLIQRFD